MKHIINIRIDNIFLMLINKKNLKISIAVVSIICLIYLPSLIAANLPSIVYEAENSTLSANVSKNSDTLASNGSSIVFSTPVTPPPSGGTYPIKVSANGRSFITADNKFFYYYADTGWLHSTRMNQSDIVSHLDDRKAKGFNTVQMHILAMPDKGTNISNIYGDAPFTDKYNISTPKEVGARTSNASSPDYDYWDHIDYIIDQAASRNIQINFAPAWYGYGGEDWRPYINNTNATTYGTFVAKRFGDKKNLMWIMGGDNDPDVTVESISKVPTNLDKSDKVQATKNMANAIRNNESVRHLMGYHASRNDSVTQYFNNEAWLTVSYSYPDERTYIEAIKDYNNSPIRPVITIEAWYDARNTLPRLNNFPEQIPDNRRLRSQGYWTFTSGGVGYGYGHEDIWDVDTRWRNAMQDTSGQDVARLIAFMNKYKVELVPDHKAGNSVKMLSNGYGTVNTNTYATSARSVDNRIGIAYIPTNRSNVVINLASFGSGSIKLLWFNPTNAATVTMGTFQASGTLPLTYPSGYSDAVLLAEKQ